MNENLSIASILTEHQDKRSYDAYCKKILSNKQILAYILKGCVPEYADLALEAIPQYIEAFSVTDTDMNENINGRNIEDEAIPGALIKYDLLFEAALPQDVNTKNEKTTTSSAGNKVCLIINLEAQNKDNPGYPLVSRALYYCSRLVAKQKNAADGFRHSEFENIKKVYSIWICIQHSDYKNDVVNTYAIHESCHMKPWNAPKEQYDLMTAIMIYPGKQYDHKKDHTDEHLHSLLELLNTLFIAKLPVKDMKEQLQKYDIIMTKEIESEVQNMCNLSDGIEERGIMKGLQQGMAQGLAQGKAEEKIDSTLLYVKNLMLAAGINAEKAMDMLGVEADIRPVILDALKCS